MHNQKFQKGSALVYGLTAIVVIAMVLVGLVSFVINNVKYSLHAEPREEAMQIAEAGMYFYRWYLAHNVDGKTAEEIDNFWSGTPYGLDDDEDGVCDSSEYYEDVYDTSGEIGTYRICVIGPAEGSSDATIYSTGWMTKKPDVKRTVKVRVRRPPWSEFALLSDAPLEVASGTSIMGGVHSNGGVRFEGSASGLVSSAVSSYDYGGDTKDGVWTSVSDESTVFLAGKAFPETPQDFNSVIVTFAEIQSAATGQFNLPVLPGGQGWHLTLNADGTADGCWVKKHNANTKAITTEDCSGSKSFTLTFDDTNAIYLQNDLWIDGTLDSGKALTIAAYHNGNGRDHTIYINGDIVYEDYVSETVLGMVAEKDIEVIQNPDLAGDGSDNSVLEIDAALLAQTGRVGRSDSYGNTLPEVRVYGAIATYQEYGFSDVTTVDLEYDPNFLTTAPPYFPTGSTYAIDLWEEIEGY